jgi:hypothetical protein
VSAEHLLRSIEPGSSIFSIEYLQPYYKPSDVTGRAVREYLELLDDAAFGGSMPVQPKWIAHKR